MFVPFRSGTNPPIAKSPVFVQSDFGTKIPIIGFLMFS